VFLHLLGSHDDDDDDDDDADVDAADDQYGYRQKLPIKFVNIRCQPLRA
jgi:hypothetical protein